MPSGIVRRIERELGITGLLNALAKKLPASDLQSLLLETYRMRVDAAKPSTILAQNHTGPAPGGERGECPSGDGVRYGGV
jgi:hypothetical protein